MADEPTGNIDIASAKEITKLLYEISKNKLVVVVTHNYEQFAEYATRQIVMHDGRIMVDKKLKETEEVIITVTSLGCNNILLSYLDLGSCLLAYFSVSYLPCFQAVFFIAAR